MKKRMDLAIAFMYILYLNMLAKMEKENNSFDSKCVKDLLFLSELTRSGIEARSEEDREEIGRKMEDFLIYMVTSYDKIILKLLIQHMDVAYKNRVCLVLSTAYKELKKGENN